MLSQTEIANLALTHLGIGKEIDQVNERSQEAASFRRVWSIAVESVLRDFAWPFATAYADLGLVQVFEPNKNNSYHYAYRKPADAVAIRSLYSGARRDTSDTIIPFTESTDADGILILTDMPPSPRCAYTKLVDNPAYYPADFTMMLSYMIAHLMAPRLSAGDPFKRGDACQQQYFYHLSVARSNAMNESQSGQDLESEMIRARDC